MPKWDPSPEWKGEDAYVIGGGDSLRNFDWGLIEGKNTVGCNSAFLLGAHICQIVIFGDIVWWEKIGRKGTEEFGGRVVGCSPRLHNHTCPWLLTMDRHNVAEFGTEKLVWAGNTGALAINLALILGAKRVFLLGFDMKLSADNKANWHDLRYEPPQEQVYSRFCREFGRVIKSLPQVFPDREVINVSDDSKLEAFPKISLAEHFQKVPA